MKKEIVVRRFLIVVILAVVCFRSSAVAGDALSETNLASETAWTLSVDGGAPQPIIVPGGGWNSDRQAPQIPINSVQDFVLYERKVEIPASATGQAVLLKCDAVNYGAEILLDGKPAGEHHGPLMPFEVDLTPLVHPGQTHVLQIKAFARQHYKIVKPGDQIPKSKNRIPSIIAVGFDYGDYIGNRPRSKFAYGITRGIKLVIAPMVRVADVFVKPSVPVSNLTADVTLQNHTSTEKVVRLSGTFHPWNKGADWKYPVVPEKEVRVPANSKTVVTLGPVSWTLGPKSYWWPNIPFREDYQPQLHFLDVNLCEGNEIRQAVSTRFGFCTHAEGPFYYTINGVRVNGRSDATTEAQLDYDAYSGAAFTAPTRPGTGCQETWRRYMRAGMNMNRVHQGTPTEYMMQAADETGFLLIPETALRGSSNQGWHDIYSPETVRDLARACRQHPSTARYSLSNEIQWHDTEFTKEWRSLIDAALEVDDTRPLVYEVYDKKFSVQTVKGMRFITPPSRLPLLRDEKSSDQRIEGVKRGHAYLMQHYTARIPRPAKEIFGIGEFAWGGEGGGLDGFIQGAPDMRRNDICYFAGWSWMNYWPNFLEGCYYERHAWKTSTNKDRRDGVDGWGSPIINLAQMVLNPYLVFDIAAEEKGAYRPGATAAQPALGKGLAETRQIEVFNDGLDDGEFALHWELRWDRPDGKVAANGETEKTRIRAGFHATVPVSFTVPDPGQDERPIYFVLESRKDGQLVFRDTRLGLRVLAKSSAN